MNPRARAILGTVPTLEDIDEQRLITVDEFFRMLDSEIFAEDDERRLELLEGRIVELPAEGPDHAEIVSRVSRFLVTGAAFPEFKVRAGSPLAFAPFSVPLPDFSVVEFDDAGRAHHPTVARLVVEISHTTLSKDRNRKARIYANAGIPEYWVVNLRADEVEVRRGPHGDGYDVVEVLRPPAVLQAESVALPPLPLAELFAEQTTAF